MNNNNLSLLAESVDQYLQTDAKRSPYKKEFTGRGRDLICQFITKSELEDIDCQKWLLWELICEFLKDKGYKCRIRFRLGTTHLGKQILFSLRDFWLGIEYRSSVKIILEGRPLWYAEFNGNQSQEVEATNDFPESLLNSTLDSSAKPGINPYQEKAEAHRLLTIIRGSLSNLSEPERGSFLFDLQKILFGIWTCPLRVLFGLGGLKGCYQISAAAQSGHSDKEPHLILQMKHEFFNCNRTTVLCQTHWECRNEGETNFLSTENWEVFLGLE